MKKTFIHTICLLGLLSPIVFFAMATPEKVIQIFRNGEVIQEYTASEIDYIEVNDLIPAPEDVNATVSDNSITIKWNAVEGARYNVYRSSDNVNFTLIASKLEETTYTDTKPLRGANYYRIKALVGKVESAFTSSAVATLTSEEMDSGVYVGVTGFNQDLYDYPIVKLSESTVGGFSQFIDGLTKKNGTLLYYSVDHALNAMQSMELPSNISTAAIVTFTDGLDQGSVMKEGVPYMDNMEYLDALNRRIKGETVSGQPITAFSIGLRGQDVDDYNMFCANLRNLASSPDNATEVKSMAEVNTRFKEIATQLSKSSYVQTINLTIPGVSNGTLVRFTFDNVKSADRSKLYIEGRFNLKERALEDVKYVGLTSTSGTTIKGSVDDIFVTFRFEGVHVDDNRVINGEFTDEWTFVTSNSSWQVNSEFDKTDNTDIVTERSSAVIMLVLDCSISLADDFMEAQKNAKDFINTLYDAIGGSGEIGGGDEVVYSTTPADLSLAIWKDGKRYYLTSDEYQNANLSNAVVEGLTVIEGGERFILSLGNIQSGPSSNQAWITKEIYGDILPTVNEGSIISARWSDINVAIEQFGGVALSSNCFYYTEETAAVNWDPYPACIHGSGGYLYESNKWGSMYIRGCMSTDTPSAIYWTDPDDLKISVILNGERQFLTTQEFIKVQHEVEKTEGVVIKAAGQRFILHLDNAQSDPIDSISIVGNLYGDILPTVLEGRIISMKWMDIQQVISFLNGTLLDANCYYYTSDLDVANDSHKSIHGDGGLIWHCTHNDGNLIHHDDYVRGVTRF